MEVTCLGRRSSCRWREGGDVLLHEGLECVEIHVSGEDERVVGGIRKALVEHVDHLVVVGCVKGAYANGLEHRVIAVGGSFYVLAEHVVGVFFLIGHQERILLISVL